MAGPPQAGKTSQVPKDARLDALYNIMQSFESRLGGGEGVQGIYGSITQSGMQRVLDCMARNCGLDGRSVLVDIGAGLGRPLLHALVAPGVRAAHGIELDDVKVEKAAAFVAGAMGEMARRGLVPTTLPRPTIQCAAIEQVTGFGAATHAYSFWEGIPVAAREAFGRLFASSASIKCVGVVQRAIRGQHPTQLLRSYGFGPLMLIAEFPVSMSGSGASFRAYIFSKLPEASVAFLVKAAARTPTPAFVSGTPMAAKQQIGCAHPASAPPGTADALTKPHDRQRVEAGGPPAQAQQKSISAFARVLKPTAALAKQTAMLHVDTNAKVTKPGHGGGARRSGRLAARRTTASHLDSDP